MPVFHSYHVRNETRVSSVAVRKGMNHYQFMMEADSALIAWLSKTRPRMEYRTRSNAKPNAC